MGGVCGKPDQCLWPHMLGKHAIKSGYDHMFHALCNVVGVDMIFLTLDIHLRDAGLLAYIAMV